MDGVGEGRGGVTRVCGERDADVGVRGGGCSGIATVSRDGGGVARWSGCSAMQGV